MFFVLSSGRSGSGMCAYVLNQYGNCVCLHHPEPELVVEATQFLYRERSAESIAQVLASTRQEIVDGRQYGEVNLQHTLLYPILRGVFPQAKFIWLIRDGRRVVTSMFYRGWYDRSATRVPVYWHDARLQADKTGDLPSNVWADYTRFEKCCWIWKKYNQLIESHLTNLDQRLWMQVRLESFKASLPEVERFLGLNKRRKITVEKKNKARQPQIDWEYWDSDQRASFERICGDAMDRWYPAWRSADGQWQAIAEEQPDAPLPGKASRYAQAVVRRVRRQPSANEQSVGFQTKQPL